MGQAAVQDARQAVAQGAQGLVVSVATARRVRGQLRAPSAAWMTIGPY